MTLQLRDLPYDNFLEITNQLDDPALLVYCSIDKVAQRFCDDKFWLSRIYTQGLELLLPYRNLYPSLKSFYLNIRNDALYEVVYLRMINNAEKHFYRYFTEIKTAYDFITKLKSDDLSLEDRYTRIIGDYIAIIISNYQLNIDKHDVIYMNE